MKRSPNGRWDPVPSDFPGWGRVGEGWGGASWHSDRTHQHKVTSPSQRRGAMWGRLDSFRANLSEGVQEFTQEFAKEGGGLVKEGLQEALAAVDKTKHNLNQKRPTDRTPEQLLGENEEESGSRTSAEKPDGLPSNSRMSLSDASTGQSRNRLGDSSQWDIKDPSQIRDETNTSEKQGGEDSSWVGGFQEKEVDLKEERLHDGASKSPRQRGGKKSSSGLSGKKGRKSGGNKSKKRANEEYQQDDNGARESERLASKGSEKSYVDAAVQDRQGPAHQEWQEEAVEIPLTKGKPPQPLAKWNAAQILSDRRPDADVDAMHQKSARLEEEVENLKAKLNSTEADLDRIQEDLSQALLRESKLEKAKAEAERARELAASEAYNARRAATEAQETVAEERKIREEALAASQQLKGDQERRAKQFESAVNAAVARTKEGLNEENLALQHRLTEVEAALQDAREEQAQALRDAEDARLEAAARLKDAQTAGTVAASAEEYAQRVAASRDAQVKRANEAEKSLADMKEQYTNLKRDLELVTDRAGRAERQIAELSQNLEYERESFDARVQEITDEAEQWRQQVQQEAGLAEKSATSCTEVTRKLEEMERQKREEVERLQQKLAESERQISDLKIQANLRKPFSLLSSTRTDFLGSLGLDKSTNDTLGLSSDSKMAGGGANFRQRFSSHPVLGKLGCRAAMVIAYILVLHAAVMLSYTSRSRQATADCHRLPGLD
eukprot:scaffold348_cov329-Pavlova_lutheri.AAC.27